VRYVQSWHTFNKRTACHDPQPFHRGILGHHRLQHTGFEEDFETATPYAARSSLSLIGLSKLGSAKILGVVGTAWVVGGTASLCSFLALGGMVPWEVGCKSLAYDDVRDYVYSVAAATATVLLL